MAQYVAYSTADCSQPGQVSTACADDIASFIRRTGEMSGYFADAVFSCGNLSSIELVSLCFELCSSTTKLSSNYLSSQAHETEVAHPKSIQYIHPYPLKDEI
jgi:hypothetical protein